MPSSSWSVAPIRRAVKVRVTLEEKSGTQAMGGVRLMITQPEPGFNPGSGTVIYPGANEQSHYMTTSYHIDTVS